MFRLQSAEAYGARYPNLARAINAIPYEAAAAIPLHYEGRVAGVLALRDYGSLYLADDDHRLRLVAHEAMTSGRPAWPQAFGRLLVSERPDLRWADATRAGQPFLVPDHPASSFEQALRSDPEAAALLDDLHWTG
jgi:hypothetical protein